MMVADESERVELIVQYTKTECGDWIDWPEDIYAKVPNLPLNGKDMNAVLHSVNGKNVFAIRTNLGSVWDVKTGWRHLHSNPVISCTEVKEKEEISISAQYKTLVEYIKLKVQQRDWHGVCDAAMDIRELVALHPEVEKDA